MRFSKSGLLFSFLNFLIENLDENTSFLHLLVNFAGFPIPEENPTFRVSRHNEPKHEDPGEVLNRARQGNVKTRRLDLAFCAGPVWSRTHFLLEKAKPKKPILPPPQTLLNCQCRGCVDVLIIMLVYRYCVDVSVFKRPCVDYLPMRWSVDHSCCFPDDFSADAMWTLPVGVDSF